MGGDSNVRSDIGELAGVLQRLARAVHRCPVLRAPWGSKTGCIIAACGFSGIDDDRLFSEANPDQHESGFMGCINNESLVNCSNAIGESSLKALPIGQSVQFEREGYFVKDSEEHAQLTFNRTVGLRDSWSE